MNSYWKGITLAFLSAGCISVTFIASKQALQELSPLAFSPLWFAAASGWGFGLYVMEEGLNLPHSLRQNFGPVLLMGVINGLANWLLFTAIALGDPTLAAFFSRSVTIYAVMLGVLILSERLSTGQWLGVMFAVMGAGAMTFRSGEVVVTMLGILLISNFLLALSGMIAKQYIEAVPPTVLSLARTLIMMFMFIAIGWLTGELVWPTFPTALWIMGGAFFGPFISYIFFYRSLRYLDLAQVEVIRATQPLFVAIYGFMLFGTMITWQQFIGGVIMLGGIILMLW